MGKGWNLITASTAETYATTLAMIKTEVDYD
jgi:hypothetical protein